MTQETQIAKASTGGRAAGRRAMAVLVVAGTFGLAGCSSVPDALNPVEWYRSTSDTVGGWFGDEETEQAAAGQDTPGDPGTSPDTAYPNLSTVPERPTPSTTPAEREALRKGLVADRANARYTEPPAASRTESSESAPASERPQAEPSPQAAVPAEPARAPARSEQPASSGDRSTLWPNRPPPETPGLRASTTGRVGDSSVRSTPSSRTSATETARAPMPARRAPAAAEQTAERTTSEPATSGRTTYDSAGSSARATPPAPEPEASRALAPSASSQSVIVNEDAIGGSGPVSPSFTGQPYLAATIYFGHGSARLTAAERQEIAEVARTAASSGAAAQVVGHASSRTADLSLRDHEMANFTISLKRAQAVADALIDAGMPADRIRIEALSDAQPEFYEVMPSGEAGNRRVEIVLLY